MELNGNLVCPKFQQWISRKKGHETNNVCQFGTVFLLIYHFSRSFRNLVFHPQKTKNGAVHWNNGCRGDGSERLFDRLERLAGWGKRRVAGWVFCLFNGKWEANKWITFWWTCTLLIGIVIFCLFRVIFYWFDPMENHHLVFFFQAPKLRKSKFRSEGLEDVIFSDLNKYAPQWPNEKLMARVEFFPELLQLQNGIQWKKWIAVELNCR